MKRTTSTLLALASLTTVLSGQAPWRTRTDRRSGQRTDAAAAANRRRDERGRSRARARRLRGEARRVGRLRRRRDRLEGRRAGIRKGLRPCGPRQEDREHAGPPVQHRLDRQGLHPDGDRAAGGRGQARAHRHDRRAAPRLSERRGQIRDHRTAPHPRRRHRRHLRSALRVAAGRSGRINARLLQDGRAGAAALRAGRRDALLQRLLRRPRRDHREGCRACPTSATSPSTSSSQRA